MAPAAIPEVKEAIRGTTLAQARELAQEALRQPTLEDVDALLNR
jgi:phosphoenolpyruvate-protein kinase (PTS system EI component)